MNAQQRQPLRTIGALALIAASLTSPAFAAFEQLGAGARPVGMANAYSAIADDAHAIHYNPAGLAQVRRGELSAEYGKLFVGLKDNSNLGSGFVGATQPLRQGKWGTLGIGWLSLSLEGAYREDTVSFSYGREAVMDGLFLGGTAKILRRSFGSDIYTQDDPLFRGGRNSNNTSFDFGTMYRPSANYSFALAVKDVNQPDVGLAGGDRVPMEIRAGFGYHQRRLLFDAEFVRKDPDVTVSIGAEKWLFKYIGLRAGFSAGSRNRREIATGVGYRGDSFGVDYAFVFPMAGVESSAGSHRFGIMVRFGKAPERALWEFEEEDKVVERLLEEKAAQISSMEKELETLRDQNRSGRLEDTWVRQQILKLEDRLKNQESKDLQDMKGRLMESKVEEERLKRRLIELENRIQRITAPRPATTPAQQPGQETLTPPAAVPAPTVPRTYTVREGDTLQTIAQKFYGEPAKWVEIYELNKDRIERGGTVRAGQILLLPVK